MLVPWMQMQEHPGLIEYLRQKQKKKKEKSQANHKENPTYHLTQTVGCRVRESLKGLHLSFQKKEVTRFKDFVITAAPFTECALSLQLLLQGYIVFKNYSVST